MNTPPAHRANAAAASLAFINAEQTLLTAGIAFVPIPRCALESCWACSTEPERRAA